MRILFTAGTQFDFPRLHQVVASVAKRCPGWALTFQAGPGASLAEFSVLDQVHAQAFFPSDEFHFHFNAADLVVTHAGMGNIIACLEAGKPFMMLPRRARLGEHRNDHQIDTAEAIIRRYNVPAFERVEALVSAIVDTASWPPGGPSAAERIHQTRSAFAKELNALLREL